MEPSFNLHAFRDQFVGHSDADKVYLKIDDQGIQETTTKPDDINKYAQEVFTYIKDRIEHEPLSLNDVKDWNDIAKTVYKQATRSRSRFRVFSPLTGKTERTFIQLKALIAHTTAPPSLGEAIPHKKTLKEKIDQHRNPTMKLSPEHPAGKIYHELFTRTGREQLKPLSIEDYCVKKYKKIDKTNEVFKKAGELNIPNQPVSIKKYCEHHNISRDKLSDEDKFYIKLSGILFQNKKALDKTSGAEKEALEIRLMAQALTPIDHFCIQYFNLREKYLEQNKGLISVTTDDELRAEAFSKAYSKVALNATSINRRFAALKKEQKNEIGKYEAQKKVIINLMKYKAELEKKIVEKRSNGEVVTGIETEIKELERKIENKLKDCPFSQLQILLATLKEQATTEAYEEDMPELIEAGFYNPSIIPNEMSRMLGNLDIPPNLKSIPAVYEAIEREVRSFQNDGKINSAQKDYIMNEIKFITHNYLVLYPDKSYEDMFVLARDLARIATYQEIFDKGAFSGSDHGAKHIHNNIDNAKGLHKHMKHGVDFTTKDQFVEHLVHFYHDTGYTVGLAAKNFDCSKDHPLIGAAVIKANENYFVKLLDKETYTILHDSVLHHAIANPKLTPDKETHNDLHYDMIRAVTSISDACAVTYDRKTQEFWEQPEAIMLLTKLKMFVTLYPKYGKILANPEIQKDQWVGLNKSDQLDILAHDIFQNTKAELRNLVNRADISKDKKKLFKQAINQQFNAFTANITFGQYGGILTGVETVENKYGVQHDGEGPKYLPKFSMAPSLVYGVLNDLFGEDQAFECFKKLVEEFGGDPAEIKREIAFLGRLTQYKYKDEDNIKKVISEGHLEMETGAAIFKLQATSGTQTSDYNKPQEHRIALRKRQEVVVNALHQAEENSVLTYFEREKLFSLIRTQGKALVQTLIGEEMPQEGERIKFSKWIGTHREPTASQLDALFNLANKVKQPDIVEKLIKLQQAENEWNGLFRDVLSQEDFSFTVNDYKNNLNKLRNKGFKPEDLNKERNILKETLIIQFPNREDDINHLLSQIETLEQQLIAESKYFVDNEKLFDTVTQFVSTQLITPENLQFMTGGASKVTKDQLMDSIKL